MFIRGTGLLVRMRHVCDVRVPWLGRAGRVGGVREPRQDVVARGSGMD